MIQVLTKPQITPLTSYAWIGLIVGAAVLDWVIGDPAWIYHPVRLIGNMIAALTEGLNRGEHRKAKGVLMWVIVMLFSFLLTLLVLVAAYIIGYIAVLIVAWLLLASALAMKSLRLGVMETKEALDEDDLPEARKRAGYLVGRQTANLSAREVTRAMVETAAENAVDGVYAPLFYMFVGVLTYQFTPLLNPVTLAMLYKTVNTLDSMVGYPQEPYTQFGWCSAKIDDIVNFLPARLSAFFLLLAGQLLGFDANRGFRIFWRDRLNHKSPNSAHSEAAIAGLLGVCLGGTNIYFGEILKKPTIGDAVYELIPKDIEDTIHIAELAELLILLFVCFIALLVYWITYFYGRLA